MHNATCNSLSDLNPQNVRNAVHNAMRLHHIVQMSSGFLRGQQEISELQLPERICSTRCSASLYVNGTDGRFCGRQFYFLISNLFQGQPNVLTTHRFSVCKVNTSVFIRLLDRSMYEFLWRVFGSLILVLLFTGGCKRYEILKTTGKRFSVVTYPQDCMS